MPVTRDLLPTINDPRNPEQSRLFAQRVAEYFDRQIGQLDVSVDTQVGDDREVVLQVIDRRRRVLSGRWLVAFYVTSTDGGDPSATDNTVSITGGVSLSTLIANAAYVALTDSDGAVTLDLGVANPGTRYVYGLVLGEFAKFGGYTWT